MKYENWKKELQPDFGIQKKEQEEKKNEIDI